MVITRGQITKGSVDSVSHHPTRMVHRTEIQQHTRNMRSLENEVKVEQKDDDDESYHNGERDDGQQIRRHQLRDELDGIDDSIF